MDIPDAEYFSISHDDQDIVSLVLNFDRTTTWQDRFENPFVKSVIFLNLIFSEEFLANM